MSSTSIQQRTFTPNISSGLHHIEKTGPTKQIKRRSPKVEAQEKQEAKKTGRSREVNQAIKVPSPHPKAISHEELQKISSSIAQKGPLVNGLLVIDELWRNGTPTPAKASQIAKEHLVNIQEQQHRQNFPHLAKLGPFDTLEKIAKAA